MSTEQDLKNLRDIRSDRSPVRGSDHVVVLSGETKKPYRAKLIDVLEGVKGVTRNNILVQGGGGVPGATGGGLSEKDADKIYLNEKENLADLRNAVTAQVNLGLKNGSADLDLLSLAINGNNFVDSSRNTTANTLSLLTGKFFSSVGYAFRNETDTDYGAVQMAGLSATTGYFSNTLTADAVAVFNSNIDANGNILLDDVASNISTDTFASGFTGTGIGFFNNGTWDGTLDNLTIRQRLRVYELMINQIRATNGSLVVTSATKTGREEDLGFAPVSQLGGTLDWTSSDPFWTETDQYWYPTYRIYVEEDQFVPFDVGALVLSQRFTGKGTYLVEGRVINVENGDPDVTVNTTRRYFDINLTKNSDVPQAGMDFVQWGHLSDPDQMGVLYLTSDDDGAPYMDIVYGINSHAARNTQETIKGRIGRLDGIVDNDFPSLDGTQVNEFGVYINGGYFNNVEVRGTLTVLDEDASNAATKAYVDNATAASGNQIIRSDTEPTSRTDGSSLVEGDLWIETDNGDKPRTYNGTSFVEAYTIIDGGNLSTNTVTAAKIDLNDLFAQNVTVNTGGSISAESGAYTFSDTRALVSVTGLTIDSATPEIAVGNVFSADGAADTGVLAGANFDANRLYNYDSSGGLELNWANQFLKMYEDNGATARVTIDGNGTTLPTTAVVRASISGTNVSTTAELAIVNYDRIFGSWVPEETSGDNLTTYDYRVIYEGWDGSVWSTLDTYDDTLAGSSVGVTHNFSIQDKSGFTKFRMRIIDRNSSGGTWQFDSYSAQQNKSEVVMNPRGTSIVGGLLYLVDIPKNTSDIPTNSVYSDEKDSNGNWILKLKA